MYEADGIFALNEVQLVIDMMLACSHICACKPSEEQTEALLRAQVQAPLICSSGFLSLIAKPKEALERIESLTELRKTVDPSDFTLMKYNLKLLIGFFPQREECLTESFE